MKTSSTLKQMLGLCEKLQKSVPVDVVVNIQTGGNPELIFIETNGIYELRPFVHLFCFKENKFLLFFEKLGSFIYFRTLETFYESYVRDKTWYEDRIAMLIAERGWKQSEFVKNVSELSGCSESTVYNYIYGNVESTNIKVVEAVLNTLYIRKKESKATLALYLLGEMSWPYSIAYKFSVYEKEHING